MIKNPNEISYFYLQELLRTTETNATKWLSNLPNYARFNCVIVSHRYQMGLEIQSLPFKVKPSLLILDQFQNLASK